MARIVLEDDDDDMSIRSREDMVVIMKESNLIYKMRKKMMKWMEEGKDLNSEALQMEADIEDFLVSNQKINAIVSLQLLVLKCWFMNKIHQLI